MVTHSDGIAILAACIGVLFLSLITFMTWVVKKLTAHDTALALLIQQVNPPGDKSLRTLLTEIMLRQVEVSHNNPSTTVANQGG